MSMAVLAAVLGATGPVVGGVSAYQQSRAQASSLNQMSRAAVYDRREQAKQLMGAQRVAFAKSGVDPETGSPLDVQATTAVSEELAARRIQSAYQKAQYQTKLEGDVALFGSLLQGASAAASSYATLGGEGTGSAYGGGGSAKAFSGGSAGARLGRP